MLEKSSALQGTFFRPALNLLFDCCHRVGTRTYERQGRMVIRPPVPAVAFRNRRIAWLMDRDFILVELS